MTVVARTPRLDLREFSIEDAPEMVRLNADPLVIQYTGDPPFADEAEARALIESYDSYARDGFGRWSVYLRETGDYAGWSGLSYSAEKDEVDVGFRFHRRFWGQGYATESALAALELGFDRFRLTKVVGRAMVDNTASVRVLEKLGMSRSHAFERDGQQHVQYEITADEWRRRWSRHSVLVAG